jgi:nucleoside-diphosphate-sugar epimerase
MEKDAKIFVAGHKGLVGSAIVRKLREKGYTNIITKDKSEVDLRRQEDVERFFESEKPEYVFLAAAKVGGILANSTYPAEFIYDNLAIALNVINSAYKYRVKKAFKFRLFVYLSKVRSAAYERRVFTNRKFRTNQRSLCHCQNFYYKTC